MAANVPNPGVWMGSVSQTVTALRNNFQAILWANDYVTSMGGATFLEAAAPNGMGMASGDASAWVAALGNLAALAAVYQGGTPGAAFSYMTNSQPLWGGQ